MKNYNKTNENVQMALITPELQNLAFEYLKDGTGIYTLSHFEDPHLWECGFRYAIS